MAKPARSSHKRKKVVHRRFPVAVTAGVPTASASTVSVTSAAAVPETTIASPVATPPTPRTAPRDYSHVKRDLMRIAVIATVLIGLLILLTFLVG